MPMHCGVQARRRDTPQEDWRIWEEAKGILSGIGLRVNEEKTHIGHARGEDLIIWGFILCEDIQGGKGEKRPMWCQPRDPGSGYGSKSLPEETNIITNLIPIQENRRYCSRIFCLQGFHLEQVMKWSLQKGIIR